MLQAFLTGMPAGGEADAGGERLGGNGVIADAVGCSSLTERGMMATPKPACTMPTVEITCGL